MLLVYSSLNQVMLQRELGFTAGMSGLCNVQYSYEVTYFYRKCHANVQDLKDIRKCPCKNLAKARFEEYSNDGKVFKSKK